MAMYRYSARLFIRPHVAAKEQNETQQNQNTTIDTDGLAK